MALPSILPPGAAFHQPAVWDYGVPGSAPLLPRLFMTDILLSWPAPCSVAADQPAT